MHPQHTHLFPHCELQQTTSDQAVRVWIPGSTGSVWTGASNWPIINRCWQELRALLKTAEMWGYRTQRKKCKIKKVWTIQKSVGGENETEQVAIFSWTYQLSARSLFFSFSHFPPVWLYLSASGVHLRPDKAACVWSALYWVIPSYNVIRSSIGNLTTRPLEGEGWRGIIVRTPFYTSKSTSIPALLLQDNKCPYF